MESLLAQVKQAALEVDDAARQRIMIGLHQLAYSMENADDTTHRISFLHLEAASTKIGIDLGLFKHLSHSGGPTSLNSLSRETGADKTLLKRILTHLATTGAVKETSTNEYAPTTITRNLATPLAEAGIQHHFESVCPQYQALPAFLKRTGYRDPTNPSQTAFHDAWKTKQDPFTWFGEHPEYHKYFNDYMAVRRGPETSWLTIYAVNEHIKTTDSDPNRAIFVNIGGGVGHQCAQFKAAYPNVQGRIVLEDLPHVVADALPTEGVENLAHNFFEAQPVKRAKFYYARGVLHDWPDAKAHQILEATKAAMAPDSILLLDDLVLPESGISAYVACTDLTMMSVLAARERTEADWRRLVEGAGLKLTKMYVYNHGTCETLMDVRLS
ncbi:S-adenosyl-L-methionine-dependent methyltransferase [Xylaria cf. heliscus]|nr:S-adenosyl-L-methionine-dependent methyltransferase [Xylaria cf. heliscus]